MGAIDEPAMQRLLQVIAAQNQQQNQELLNLQQQHTDILGTLTTVAQNAPVARIILPEGFSREGPFATLGASLRGPARFSNALRDSWSGPSLERRRGKKII